VWFTSFPPAGGQTPLLHTARKDGQKKKWRQFVVTVETAQKIVEVCRRISECQMVLNLLEADNLRSNRLTFRNRDNDAIFDLYISPETAKGVLQAEIAKLQANYEVLNNEAIKEANKEANKE
jgi:hypothetical protein